MEIGRPDFDTPAPIKESTYKALQSGRVHYTNSAGIRQLREALSEKLSVENNLQYGPGEIIVTAGASEALFCCFMAFLDPGDE